MIGNVLHYQFNKTTLKWVVILGTKPVLVSLTLKLISIPKHGWPQLVALCEREERLPSPLNHAAALGGISVVATVIGSTLKTGSTINGTTIDVLAAVIGYVGAALISVLSASAMFKTSGSLQNYASRFASAASLPIIASGVFNAIPFSLLGILATFTGSLLCFWSGSVGAREMLGLVGAPQRKAALTIAVLSSIPIYFVTIFRMTSYHL